MCEINNNTGVRYFNIANCKV